MLGNYPKAFFVTDGRTGNAILKRVMAKYPDWPKNVKLELSPCGYIEAVKYYIGQMVKNMGRLPLTARIIRMEPLHLTTLRIMENSINQSILMDV